MFSHLSPADRLQAHIVEIDAVGPLDPEAAQPFSVKTVRYNPAAVSFAPQIDVFFSDYHPRHPTSLFFYFCLWPRLGQLQAMPPMSAFFLA